jgi:hypothetical protein
VQSKITHMNKDFDLVRVFAPAWGYVIIGYGGNDAAEVYDRDGAHLTSGAQDEDRPDHSSGPTDNPFRFRASSLTGLGRTSAPS